MLAQNITVDPTDPQKFFQDNDNTFNVRSTHRADLMLHSPVTHAGTVAEVSPQRALGACSIGEAPDMTTWACRMESLLLPFWQCSGWLQPLGIS